MPAVVAPQDYDRIVGIGAICQRIQHDTHAGIGITGRSHVGTHRFLHHAVFLAPAEIHVRSKYLVALAIQDVVEVIHSVFRDLHRCQIVEVEVFLRRVKRQVWFGKPDSHEKWSVVVPLQLLFEPLGRFVVLGTFVASEQRPERKTRATALGVFGIRQLLAVHDAFVTVIQLRRIGFPATRFLPPNIKGPMPMIDAILGRVFMKDLS